LLINCYTHDVLSTLDVLPTHDAPFRKWDQKGSDIFLIHGDLDLARGASWCSSIVDEFD
jgi:hypothetical protein